MPEARGAVPSGALGITPITSAICDAPILPGRSNTGPTESTRDKSRIVDSIPTSANQEDHVSMGGYSARKARQILNNTNRVIAIEMVNAAQGMDFRAPLKPGKGSGAAYAEFRKHVPFYEKDQFMQPLLLKSLELVENGTMVEAVEKEIGELK